MQAACPALPEFYNYWLYNIATPKWRTNKFFFGKPFSSFNNFFFKHTSYPAKDNSPPKGSHALDSHAPAPPADPAPIDAEAEIARLLTIMAALRDPATGCPWDLVQTWATIAPYTIEEAYEVADAIAAQDLEALPDELGDLLFQVVYHARLAQEAGLFTFADVARRIADKMVRRHPHVFAPGDAAALGWEGHKRAERAARRQTGALAGVAPGLPALSHALKLTTRAGLIGRLPECSSQQKANLGSLVRRVDVLP